MNLNQPVKLFLDSTNLGCAEVQRPPSDQLRKQRLRYLMEQVLKIDQKTLADRARITEGRVSQLLQPDEPFGERAGRNLATALREWLHDEFYFEHGPIEGVAQEAPLEAADPLEAILLAELGGSYERRHAAAIRLRRLADRLDAPPMAAEPSPPYRLPAAPQQEAPVLSRRRPRGP